MVGSELEVQLPLPAPYSMHVGNFLLLNADVFGPRRLVIQHTYFDLAALLGWGGYQSGSGIADFPMKPDFGWDNYVHQSQGPNIGIDFIAKKFDSGSPFPINSRKLSLRTNFLSFLSNYENCCYRFDSCYPKNSVKKRRKNIDCQLINA
jgi:hypothetical protein